jgi:hypothetical protein
VLELILLVVRSFGVARRGHKDLVLENMALRQQCRVLQRTARPRFRARDRMFWVLLARTCDLGGLPLSSCTRNRDAMASRMAPPAVGAVFRPEPCRTSTAGS